MALNHWGKHRTVDGDATLDTATGRGVRFRSTCGRRSGAPGVALMMIQASCLVLLAAAGPAGADPPLLEAAAKGDTAEVTHLLADGADVNAKDQHGWAPLHLAAFWGRTEVVELLVANGAKIDIKTDIQAWGGGKTPLWEAASRGHRDIANLLIAQGADVNAKPSDGRSPLHMAAWKGHHHMVQLLVAKGADVNATDEKDMTPLHWAANEGQIAAAEALLARGAHLDIFAASGLGRKNDVARMLKQSPQLVNAKGPLLDRAPLYWAARRGNEGVASLLIAKGGDVNARDSRDTSPLHCAAAKGRKSVVELLIAKGADVNAKDDQGSTPLASVAGYLASGEEELAKLRPVLELLIAKGADVHASDDEGRSPSDVAELRGNRAVAAMLFDLIPRASKWRRHVSDFCERHKLTDPQRASAEAVLRDLESRAAGFERVHLAGFIKLSQAGKWEELARRMSPLDKMFEELKKRLQALLTAEQRTDQ